MSSGSSHRYTRVQQRPANASTSAVGGVTSLGPPGVDWGGDFGGPAIVDPLAAFGFGTNSGGNGNGSSHPTSGGSNGGYPPVSAFGGLTVTTTTMSAHPSSQYPQQQQQHGGSGYQQQYQQPQRQNSRNTPPELRGADLAGFMAANRLSGGGGSAQPPTAPHPLSNSGVYDSHRATPAGFPADPSVHRMSGSPPPQSINGYPPPFPPSSGGSNAGGGGGQTFSGNNIVSILAAARHGTSPPSLPPAAAAAASHNNSNAAGLSLLALIGGGASSSNATSGTFTSSPAPAATSGVPSQKSSPPIAQRSVVPPTPSSAPAAAAGGHTHNTVAAPPMAVGQTPPPSGNASRLTSPTTARPNNSTAPASGVGAPATAGISANAKQQQQQNNNSNKANNNANVNTHTQNQNNNNNNNNSAAAAAAPAAPLQSRVLTLPPQHEVFVLFPTADAVRAHLRTYGAAYNLVPVPNAAADPAADSVPSSPLNLHRQLSSASALSGASAQTVSGASRNANLDALGIAQLFAAGAGPNGRAPSTPGSGGINVASLFPSSVLPSAVANNNNAKGNSKKNSKHGSPTGAPDVALPAIPAGYCVSKPQRTYLRPRVYIFGRGDHAPLALDTCYPAGEGVGLLFRNEGAAEEGTGGSGDGGFIGLNGAADVSASGVFPSLSQANFNASLSSQQQQGLGGASVSVSAELVVYNAVTIGAVRPMDTKAKDIHDYLNALRTDALANGTRGPNVLIVGATDTGKSSLAQFLINAHIRESFASFLRFQTNSNAARRRARDALEAAGVVNPTAAQVNAASREESSVVPPFNSIIQLIDLDVGQQGAALPGCVSATNFMYHNKALVRSGQSVFYGDTSLYGARDVKSYLGCAESLLKLADNVQGIDRWELDRRRMYHYPSVTGRVINTMGYTTDAGFDALVELVGICKADVVVVTGKDSALQFRLQDAIAKRYGGGGDSASSFVPTSALNALSPSNARVAKHFVMPTFMLYDAPDCPVTPQTLRRAKREARIDDYFKCVRYGDASNLPFSTSASNATPGMIASPAGGARGTPPSAAFPSTPASGANGTPGSNAAAAAAAAANSTASLFPNPTRLLSFKVPLSRLDIRDAKTLIPITGKAFHKMGTQRLAAIPLPAYNEVGGGNGSGLSANALPSFFPLLEPAVSDEGKLSWAAPATGGGGGNNSKNPTAPSSPNASGSAFPSTTGADGAAAPAAGANNAVVPNPSKTEIDSLLLPNSRGVVAFAAMMGLSASGDGVELLFDAAYVAERLREASVLRGGTIPHPSNRRATDPAAIAKAFLTGNDFNRERITLLLSNIAMPDETVKMLSSGH